MKRLTTTMCLVLLTLSAVTGYSQNKQAARPVLFASLPPSIDFTDTQLNNLFIAAKGQNINVSLGNNSLLSGTVTSSITKYNNLQTVIIKLPAFNNSLFSLSKQTDATNNINYVGRILNPLYADGFELKRNTQGIYQLVKINVEKILVNCNQ